MRGILKKTTQGWVVEHSTTNDVEVTILLHPDNVRWLENEYVYYKDMGDNPLDVDFELVTEEYDNGKGCVYARLNTTFVFSNDKLAVNDTVDDFILNAKEISDEEIQEEAKLHSNYYEFIAGAKWYREQLKKQ